REIGQLVLSPEPESSCGCENVVGRAATNQNRGSFSQPAHCEMKTTPTRISNTPAQRRQSTCSFSSTRARRVSGINVAADIGTAKLIGAIETSFIKEKKETAMAQVEMIT